MDGLNISLNSMRDFYNSSATLSYEFIKKQSSAFEQAIKKYDDEINAALYADLKKARRNIGNGNRPADGRNKKC